MKTVDYFDTWLDLKRNRVADSTWNSYKDIVDRFLIPRFGDMDLAEISSLDVELFITSLYESNYAPSTIQRIYAVLRCFMNKMHQLDVITTNPTAKGRIEPIKSNKKAISILSSIEIAYVNRKLTVEPIRWHAFVTCAIDSGARRGELVSLRWTDLKSHKLSISHSIYKAKNQKSILKPTKSGKCRTVTLSVTTLKLLKLLKLHQRKICLQNGIRWTSDFFVFGGVDPLHPDSPSNWWRKFLKRNSIDHVPLHSLRHTSATLLLSNGVDLKTVSERLGHSGIEVTEIYLHLLEENDLKAAEIMNELLFVANK
ncbi:site-specific integrase [Chakrabartyella piscis]|uniref:tyrosine-type recombinase/integrase n=1 Tax=Chakrabartyella piscis TaxID=2918914 RepID=UPI0029588AE3|nr:site-specific integrase [Chakrabartyella piscis]